MMKFHEFYQQLLALAVRSIVETNARTGIRIRVLAGSTSIVLDMSDNIVPSCGTRKQRPHVAAAEAAWVILGHDHVDWLRRYTKTWDAFCDVQDGSYLIQQAYGYRLRRAFGVDQLNIALERLRNDPSDRRVWLSTWSPADDLPDDGQKTVPCPVGFTLSIVDRMLNSSLMIRSSDLYFGLPVDVMRHAFLMAAVGATLGTGLGYMRVTLAHPHIYEPQWEICRQMSIAPVIAPAMPLPPWDVATIEAEPDTYVEAVKGAAEAYDWHPFNPRQEVVK